MSAFNRPSNQVASGPKNMQAFSLTEMLIVISVIGLLFAMLLPALRSAQEQVRIVVCSTNISAIGRAAAAYAEDWNGWLCGSPGTSGSIMFYADPRPEPEAEDLDTDPTQIWDYAGPLAERYMNMASSGNRAERLKALVAGPFACPSNSFEADPYPEATGSFEPQPMVSYNTFRNFLMWSRTMVDRNPNQPWGRPAPVPEASFDNIGGRTLQPKNYVPRIERIGNPAGKAYLADGNRFTDEDGHVAYDLEWDALDGGAFCNGGPTLREWDGPKFVLSAYHYDKELGQYAYRHHRSGQRGIVVNFFDGHSEFMSEAESRKPETWWPKGTIIPFPDFNEVCRALVIHKLDRDGNYHVGW